MTNPNNSLGTNGALGGRTSVNAFNDVLQTFDGAGILSGFVVEPDSGMTVAVGGDGTTRDVAVAEDPFGNRTTVDNISGDPISVTINTASTTSARIDSIVAYVNSPAQASDTSVDNPTACGIIAVNGTSGGAPLDSAIRTAITADGGTGSTAYYVVIANVSVPANTTAITSGLISAGKSINLSNVATSGSNGLMSGADKAKIDSITVGTPCPGTEVITDYGRIESTITITPTKNCFITGKAVVLSNGGAAEISTAGNVFLGGIPYFATSATEPNFQQCFCLFCKANQGYIFRIAGTARFEQVRTMAIVYA